MQIVPTSKSSPISTSGDGFSFEHSVQAFFVAQMVLQGLTPRMGYDKITSITLQSGRYGRNTDDCEVTLRNTETGSNRHLLVQIKRSFKTSGEDFHKTIDDAWRDFKGPNSNFNKDLDKIMLITGGLNGPSNGLKTMLTYIQSAYTSPIRFWADYNSRMTGRSKDELKGFSRLLERLQVANGAPVSEKDIFDFCRSFVIIKTDLHENSLATGDINITLIHSMLSTKRWKNNAKPKDIWAQLHLYIANQNKNQINIRSDDLQEELKELFAEDKITTQTDVMLASEPGNISTDPSEDAQIKTEHKRVLAQLCLVGQFDASNSYDRSVVSGILNTPYEDVLKKIQSISTDDDHIVELRDTVWRVINPLAIISKLSNYIFDDDMDRLKDSYIKVLGEIDPALDLPVEDRRMASLYSKNHRYSEPLRDGTANGMAMVANNQDTFSKCSFGKVASTAVSSVRGLLENSDSPGLWASITDYASMIAQAAPKDFLTILEEALETDTSRPFLTLSEESSGDAFFGKDYVSGFRRALADLSWSEELFARSMMILGKLSTYEPQSASGQNQALDTILHTILPWRPQTLASLDTRYRVVEKVLKNHRKEGLSLLRGLLPNMTQTSVERQYPVWININIDEHKNTSVTMKELWSQGSHYSRLFVETIKSADEIIDAINNINHLTDDAIELLTANLEKNHTSFSKQEQRIIWGALLAALSDIDRRPKPGHATSSNTEKNIRKVAVLFEPKDMIEKYAHLFSHYDHELIGAQDWEDGVNKVKKDREDALLDIIRLKYTKGLLRLIEISKLPQIIGSTLGGLRCESLDDMILANFLESDSTHDEFVRAFMHARFYYHNESVKWIEEAQFSSWGSDKKLCALLSLPFKRKVWDLLDRQSKHIFKMYWDTASNIETIYGDGYSEYAVDNLLKARRPLAALQSIYWSTLAGKGKIHETKINNDQCLKALLESVDTTEDVSVTRRMYHELGEIFNYLYSSSNFAETDLWKAEWAYLPLFSNSGVAQPLALTHLIANDPGFFCELVKTGYRSKNDDTREVSKIPEQVQRNLLKILSFNDFRIMPGTDVSGKFRKSKFTEWVKQVEIMCKKSGHLEVAQSILGGYLINSPSDSSGLWIDKTVANILNRQGSDEIRSGFNTAAYNSRGIHSVDTTGSEEAKLGEHWKGRAEDVERAGYLLFATSLRELADGYEHDRRRVIQRASLRS